MQLFNAGSVALPYSNSGQPQGRPRIQSLRCMGDEASVLDCQYSLTDVSYCSYASVQCLGMMMIDVYQKE